MKYLENLQDLRNSKLMESFRPRLVPVVTDNRTELRIVSVLLATLTAVPPFAKNTLDRFGVRLNKTSTLNCFVEVPFKSNANDTDALRPDGVIQLRTGSKTWTALVEAKVKNNPIDPSQIETYASVAAMYHIDAIITISNQLAFLPTHIPYQVPRKYTKKIQLYHMSWISLLRHAQLLMHDQESNEINSDQAFLLNETIRYFDHVSSGVKSFNQMNAEWPSLINAIRDNHTLNDHSREIENTVTSWHQEERDVCLTLSTMVGKTVSIRSTKNLKEDATLRFQNTSRKLTESCILESKFVIPDAASDLDVLIDITRRTISCSMTLDSPKDRKKPTAAINWLLQQLRNVDATDVTLRANWSKQPRTTQAKLQDVRENPSVLVNEAANSIPKSLEVLVIKEPVRARFSSKKNFILDLETYIPEFYDRIGQKLRKWMPKPPKITTSDTSVNVARAEVLQETNIHNHSVQTLSSSTESIENRSAAASGTVRIPESPEESQSTD